MYTGVTLLALFAAAAAAPTASEAGISHTPYNRRSLAPRDDGTADIGAFFQEWNATLAKYKADHRLKPLSKLLGGSALDDVLDKRAVSTIKLKDQGADIEYYGPGTVGGQSFTIDFDTGSSDLFVPGPNCSDCKGTPYDNSGVSEGRTTSVTYGSGSVAGDDYYDTVCVGGLCTEHTNLISLTTASGFSTSKSNSLMGLAFESISSSKRPTFFEKLVKSGKLTANEFSFYLGRKKSGTGPNSVLTFGGKDSSKYTGSFSEQKVTKKGYWQVAIDGVTVNGDKTLLSAGQAAIDSGTTVIITPVAAIADIALALDGVTIPVSAEEIAFAYPCHTTKKVSLEFGGKTFAVKHEDLNLGVLTTAIAKKLGNTALGGLCLAAVIGDEIDPPEELYVVGDTFLKNWYATFNYDVPSVSFAKSV